MHIRYEIVTIHVLGDQVITALPYTCEIAKSLDDLAAQDVWNPFLVASSNIGFPLTSWPSHVFASIASTLSKSPVLRWPLNHPSSLPPDACRFHTSTNSVSACDSAPNPAVDAL